MKNKRFYFITFKEQKTVLEWLNELPDGYRERALDQCDDDCNYLKAESMPEALLSFNSWNNTYEKDMFWRRVWRYFNGERKTLPKLPK